MTSSRGRWAEAQFLQRLLHHFGLLRRFRVRDVDYVKQHIRPVQFVQGGAEGGDDVGGKVSG